MNNLKEKMKNAGFWTSLGAGFILFMQSLSQIFGFGFNSDIANTIINSICTILISLGIISNPKEGKWYMDTKDDNKKDNIKK